MISNDGKALEVAVQFYPNEVEKSPGIKEANEQSMQQWHGVNE